MSNFFEKLRQRPEQERHRIVITTATVITAFIVLVWVSLLYTQYLSTSEQKKTIQHTTSPFEVFFKDLKERANAIQDSYKSATDVASEVSEEINKVNSVSSSTNPVSTSTEAQFSSVPEEQ